MFRFPMQASRRSSATIAIIAAAFFAVAVPASLSAQLTVATTKHNFSVLGGRATVPGGSTVITGLVDYNEICVYCHTPHGGSLIAPLWNRATRVGYTMYTLANSATMDMLVSAQPGPVSLACLSCHDGAVGLDVITNAPNPTAAATTGPTMAGVFATAPGSFMNLATDLQNDHPIGVTYNPALDVGSFRTQAAAVTSGMRFYGSPVDRVECASCHNVHVSTNVPFLRIANTGSALCLACHIK